MPYHLEYRRNGTEDELIICRPNGDHMAFIQFWDEPDTNDGRRAELEARHIVDALNAYPRQLRLPKRVMKENAEPAPWDEEFPRDVQLPGCTTQNDYNAILDNAGKRALEHFPCIPNADAIARFTVAGVFLEMKGLLRSDSTA